MKVPLQWSRSVAEGDAIDRLVRIRSPVQVVSGMFSVDNRVDGSLRPRRPNLMRTLTRLLFALMFALSLAGGSFGSIRHAGAQDAASNADSSQCHAYKANNGNESESGGKNRLEVGGSSPQMVDYYPAEGVLAVSYILPVQSNVFTWWGYGSVWEYAGNCDMDYIRAQTKGYITGEGRSIARLDHGHSGVMVDMTDGTVSNFGTLSDEEVDALLEVHRAGIAGKMDTNGDGQDEGSGQPTNCSSTESAYGGVSGCLPESSNVDTGNLHTNGGKDADNGDCVGVSDDTNNFASKDGDSVQVPADGPVTFAEFWTNWAGMDQTAMAVYLDPLPSGQTYTLNGGGQATYWPKGCEDEARASLTGGTVLTIEDLQAKGLAGENKTADQ